ncbi:MAG TPA: hypothetical protein VKM54_14360 [Myxococcota bacterium]|nr:hypothetical protein [Myxococcota bacterium]
MPPEPSSNFDPEPARRAASHEKPAPTPFDNPWLLPILLVGFALWFSYDGWLNPNTKSILFNRICAPISALAALWFTRGALRENRLRRENEQRGQTGARS